MRLLIILLWMLLVVTLSGFVAIQIDHSAKAAAIWMCGAWGVILAALPLLLARP